MPRPTTTGKHNRIVDVVVDPALSKHLREHQRYGVKFLYECVMGMKSHGGMGAILADDMGLGKSLQVIALLWTLLKQNPVFDDPPVVKKAVIVCPVSVVGNWKKEIRKWLGERVGVFVVDDKNTRIKNFTQRNTYDVMVVGYERFRTVQPDLADAGVDLVIADEGHRLKTAANKCGLAIKALDTPRRIVLSGTPLQNDLSEIYFLSDLVNPGVLGKPSAFKREFETPIARSRESDASPVETTKGNARAAELAEITEMYLLRRGMEIIAEFLPPKSETVLFCKPTAAQAQVYKHILLSPTLGTAFNSTETAFQLISVLKKVCNSPHLLRSKKDVDEAKNDAIATMLAEMPSNLLKSPASSGKLQVLDTLLHAIRTTTDEKVVLVSHYTSTLDILGNLLSSLGYPFLRLDGSTANTKRQGLIDRFNRTPASSYFAFLLSAKSGGAGISLVGASRLVLFDVDWNPSTEDQAMARIHRDGQKRPCRIYRLLMQGALDEKIYQRQLTKRALADQVVDGKQSATTFSRDELKRLFSLDEGPRCQTHELLGCTCGGSGVEHDQEDATEPGTENAGTEISDSDNEEPITLGDLMSASQLMRQEEKQEKRRSASPHKRSPVRAEGKSTKHMQSLMRYRHIDPALLVSGQAGGEGGSDVGTLLGNDDVLERVLTDPEIQVGYAFTRTFHAHAKRATADTDGS